MIRPSKFRFPDSTDTTARSLSATASLIASCLRPEMFTREYAQVFAGDDRWRSLPVPAGGTFAWDPFSTYVRRPPYFDGLPAQPAPLRDIRGARVLALLGDSVTTDHISPAGAIKADSPAGRYLREHGVQPADFNSYGSRRGNHEVMIRGTFANIRLRNQLAPGTEGGVTRHLPDGEQMTIFDAAQRYAADAVPLLVVAGLEYGSGSSRDWAAKGTALLGVAAVLAVSYERIHRSNLIGMGVLPLQFPPGQDAASLGLTGVRSSPSAGWPGRRRCRARSPSPPTALAGRASLPPPPVSTPPARPPTTGTAASFPTSCATSPPAERPGDRCGDARRGR